MRKVFVSYSHEDGEFADRLVFDLRLAEIPATYDQWILNVGDSIIARIAQEVSEADHVIALLSPASVKSNWVAKELSLAVTGEIASKRMKVLPALIQNCVLPEMLSDKLYADFRFDYYRGMRALLRTLLPDRFAVESTTRRLRRLENAEASRLEFSRLLESSDIDVIRDWLQKNPAVFSGLFGHLWNVFEVISSPPLLGSAVDFAVINGQSSRYDISLICLRGLAWPGISAAREEADNIAEILNWCRLNQDSLCRSLALRMTNGYGPGDLARASRRVSLYMKVFMGRRSEYGEEENEARNQIYQHTGRDVDIASYDRVVDLFDWKNNRE